MLLWDQCFSLFFPLRLQEGREQYELAATSEHCSKKKAKGKKKEKDMDELKKEVDMVSVSARFLLLPTSLPRPLGFIV